MATNHEALVRLSNEELETVVRELVARERSATAALIAALAEFDERRLYLPEGFPSLFAYCTGRLHLSEHAAYHRIEAARAARRFPEILSLLTEGALTLTAVALLRPHLTDENHLEVLAAGRHQTKRGVEELVARLHSRPDLRPSVRKAPERHAPDADPEAGLLNPAGQSDGRLEEPPQVGPAATREAADRRDASATGRIEAAPARPAVVRPSAPSRFHVQLTISAETHSKLRHAQDLLRHVVPNGDLAVVFDRALTVLVQDLERKKLGASSARRAAASSEPGNGTPRRKRRAPRAAPSAPQGAQAGRAASSVGVLPGEAPPPEPPRHAERSRRIPAAVKREVWARDGGQCGFVGTAGRCPERGFLEFHHEVPFAVGGEATAANVSVRCRRHNGHEAERFFGRAVRGPAADGQLGPDRVQVPNRHG